MSRKPVLLERMFFDALKRVRRGVVTCVFDGPDRIQHMFWRYLEKDHPALRGEDPRYPDAIREGMRQALALEL